MQLRSSIRFAAVLAAAAMFATLALAQTGAGTPAAPQSAPASRVPATPTPLEAPTPAAAPITFPKPNPLNFTADSPSVDTINAFLKASWGFDANRIWQVEAVLKTPVPGLTKILVGVGEKGSGQAPGSLQFFVLPDGKHLIAEDVLPFGAQPFADNRKLLIERANGPARGAASRDLLFVEFADFQCPHCKEAQATVERLVQEFPTARFVYENLPLVQIHTEAYKASAYSVCVAKAGGDDAFFKFSKEVFDNQSFLTPEASDHTLGDAVTKAGLDPAKIAACSTSPEAKSAVDASLKLASDLGVNSTPTLYVNGRALPLGGPYDKLKEVIAYQIALDGLKQAGAASGQ